MRSQNATALLDLDDDVQNDVRQQKRLLTKCIQHDEPLSVALTDAGIGYDDLQYERSRSFQAKGNAPLSLDGLRRRSCGIPIVSFFAGAGGLDLGFEAAGFDHVASVEINRVFCDTLRLNRPSWAVIGPPNGDGDVSNFEQVASSLHPLIPSRKFEGVFVGGPPCQPFSIAANQRFSKAGKNFKRVGFANATHGNLLFDYLWLLKRFQPAGFLIENVPGVVEIDGGLQIRQAIEELTSAGYRVEEPMILDASRHGVPQQRRRVFIVGVRLKGRFSYPSPLLGTPACGASLLRPIGRAQNHVTREHSAESVSRYMRLWYGERDQLGRVDRLDPAKPSKTVIAGGVSGGGRSHLHPEIPRTLSVRECARLQTFPDDYVFTGPVARQYTQVGNAVPPVLAAQLAIRLRSALGH